MFCIGIVAAIASLITIDHYNMTQTQEAYLTEPVDLSSTAVPQLNRAFRDLPQVQQPVAQRYAARKPHPRQLPSQTLSQKLALQKPASPKSEALAAIPKAIAAPKGWKAVQVSEGVTAYVAPEAIESIDSESNSGTRDGWATLLDGTRSPYVTAIDLADLLANPIAPQHYVWQGVWQGEGYSREHDAEGGLVAQQEGGNNIHLNLSYNAAITDPQQPNLMITIASQQDKTAQLTNMSAFLLDSQTGKTLARKDFAQLPPFYHVSLTQEGVEGQVMKSLPPLGTVTFAFHVASAELPKRFPIQLEAVNQLAEERAQEIAALEAQGWIVKEVPPPDHR
ncbi:MAG: hypothetical protein HY785_27085 [Oscillatoriophycideae cyanobacterium NC_groundwater_1537_Pr4_S-0.65um_50_18]|nr:hypothetical protein [Oscillatoriophycideae cyanobacterium NC_groundwater_1537_Pr4_S-0.65um_50_18]